MADQPPQSANPHRFGDDWSVETEFRGEMIHYMEHGRRISMMWTWTNGYRIYPDSISDWSNPDGSSSPVSAEEKAEIIHRLMKYAREKQGVVMLIE